MMSTTPITERYTQPCFHVMFPKWAGEKPKYFMETCANVLWYASQAFPEWKYLNSSSASLSKLKAFFGLPGAIKGALELRTHWVEGKQKPLRDYVGSVGYIISDAIDGIKGFTWSEVISLNQANSALLDKIKNVAAILGLVNSVYNDTKQLQKLSNQEVGVADQNSFKDPETASQIKAQWLNSETNRIWWNRERNVMGVALCCLGLAASSFTISPWIFAVSVTTSIAGKMLTHFNKQSADFWKAHLVQQIKKNS